jgi:RNA-directed DNA polymerase
LASSSALSSAGGSFGYRKGRKTADALTKIWREVESGSEWIVDADLKDFFGSVNHKKLLTLVGKQIADSRVLKLIQQMLEAVLRISPCGRCAA